MKVRISNMADAAVKMLKTGNDVSYERKDRKNDSVIREIYRRIITGVNDVCVHYRKKGMVVINRSPRTEGVQVTYFGMLNGEYVPNTHSTITDANTLTKEHLDSGWYELI